MLHAHLDNLSIEGIKKLSKITTRFEIPSFLYKLYILAKQVWHILHQLSKQEIQTLHMVHTDLIGPITASKYNRSRYCLFFTDDAIYITKNKLFKTKSQMEQAICRYTNKMKWQLKLKVKVF